MQLSPASRSRWASQAQPNLNRAIALLRNAQHLALNADNGLQVRIMNEDHDLEMHRALNNVIIRLERINHANQTTY